MNVSGADSGFERLWLDWRAWFCRRGDGRLLLAYPPFDVPHGGFHRTTGLELRFNPSRLLAVDCEKCLVPSPVMAFPGLEAGQAVDGASAGWFERQFELCLAFPADRLVLLRRAGFHPDVRRQFGDACAGVGFDVCHRLLLAVGDERDGCALGLHPRRSSYPVEV